MVAPWSADELASMFILVTIHTEREFEFEPRLLPQGSMAGGAGHGCVREDQGKSSLRVIVN
jgi:hypothetical protein